MKENLKMSSEKFGIQRAKYPCKITYFGGKRGETFQLNIIKLESGFMACKDGKVINRQNLLMKIAFSAFYVPFILGNHSKEMVFR